MSSTQSEQYVLLQKFFAEHYKYELPASLHCMMQSDTCNYMVFPSHVTWSNIVQVSRKIELCVSTDLPYGGAFDFPEDFLTRKNTLFTYPNARHQNTEEKPVGYFLDNEKYLCREEYFLIMQFLFCSGHSVLLDDSFSITSLSIPYKKEKKQKDPKEPDVMVAFSRGKKISLLRTPYKCVEGYTKGREKEIVHQW